jgi:hypothetical protein
MHVFGDLNQELLWPNEQEADKRQPVSSSL